LRRVLVAGTLAAAVVAGGAIAFLRTDFVANNLCAYAVATIEEATAAQVRVARCSVDPARGKLTIEGILEAELEPYHAADGTITTLRDSLFSTVPGSPAYVAKAPTNKVNLPEHGLTWEFSNRNAIQADYRMEFQA